MEACSSPSASSDGPRRKREVRQCGHPREPRRQFRVDLPGLDSRRISAETGSSPVRPASRSAGIPARIKGITAALPGADGPWTRVPVHPLRLTDTRSSPVRSIPGSAGALAGRVSPRTSGCDLPRLSLDWQARPEVPRPRECWAGEGAGAPRSGSAEPRRLQGRHCSTSRD